MSAGVGLAAGLAEARAEDARRSGEIRSAEYRASKGSAKVNLWRKRVGELRASKRRKRDAEMIRPILTRDGHPHFYDRQFVIPPQVAHSAGYSRNRHLLWYAMQNFLAAPAPVPAS